MRLDDTTATMTQAEFDALEDRSRCGLPHETVYGQHWKANHHWMNPLLPDTYRAVTHEPDTEHGNVRVVYRTIIVQEELCL